MPDERPTKIAVLGWFAELEKWEKTPGKKKENNNIMKETSQGGQHRLERSW